MTAQLSGSVAADSLLYSFTPATVGRGGGPATPSSTGPPPPLSNGRRLRAHSVPGEPTHRDEEADELHADAHAASPRPPSSSNTNMTNSTNISLSSASFSSGGATPGSLAMPAKPPILTYSRCGSADRNNYHHHNSTSTSLSLASLSSLTASATAASGGAGAGAGGNGGGSGPMPLIGSTSSGGGGCGLPPMRHSISGNPAVGLPKLDLPAIAFGGNGGGGGPLDLPGLGSCSSGRRSHSGGFCDAAAAAALLDAPLPPPLAVAVAFDGSAPPSPSRNGAPAVLAPLRVSGAFTASGGGAAADAGGSGGGWCGSASGGSFTSSGSKRYTASVAPIEPVGGLPLSPGSLMPCASEAAVVMSPLTPSLPSSSSCPPPPRRSHSLTSKSPAGGRRLLSDSGGGVGAAGAAADGGSVAVAPNVERSLEAPAAVAGRERSGVSSSTAVKAMNDINSDLQRAAGALLALQGPAFRPRSPPGNVASQLAAAAAPPPPAPLTASQLVALKDLAPELQWELRVAVRRVFQVLRQELSAAPSSSGRQFCGSVHECWATLDSYLEGTTELTCALVEGALEARREAPPPPPVPRPPAAALAGGGGGAAAVDGAAASLDEAQREADRLRTDNVELRRQLEECRARLARSEARVAEAEAAAAAAAASVAAQSAASTGGGTRGPGVGAGAGTGSSPRPPPPSAAPPLDRCCGTSPRRGKHALVQSLREDSASSADGGGATPPSLQPPSAAEAAAAGGSGPRRFDRAAVLARGPSYDEMIIEGDDSEDSDVEDDSYEARRHMLTYHSASFAEWVRGARRR